MRRAPLEFNPKVRGAQVAVVYFAGHGIELEGENWLVPIDAELKTDLDTKQEAISLRAIVLMVSAASQLGLIVLDARRNNPFLAKLKRSIATRGVERGLRRVEPMNNAAEVYGEVGLEINFLFRFAPQYPSSPGIKMRRRGL
jgi:uncharacterized caspase-like protein